MKIMSPKTETNKDTQQNEKMENETHKWWRPILLFSFLAIVLVFIKEFGILDHLFKLKGWIKEQGDLGYIIFVLIHIAAMIAAVPRSILAVAAGLFFAPIMAIILVTISSYMGVIITFLIARYYARDVVRRWLLRSKKLNSLYLLTEKHGAIIVIITRLLTFSPSNLLNYCFGLTKINIYTYLFWSFLCMIPATVVYVLAADAVTRGLSEVKIPWVSLSIVTTLLFIVFTVVYFVMIKLKNKEQITE
jgi:uncharacterized membrane protein YdjX (TVP38/TMEM64 family)